MLATVHAGCLVGIDAHAVQVEAQIGKGLPGLDVVGLPEPSRGQDVAAAIVLKPGASLDADACRQRLVRDLSAYKVPRHYFFCDKAELPFTDSGKIDKRRLAAILEARAESS